MDAVISGLAGGLIGACVAVAGIYFTKANELRRRRLEIVLLAWEKRIAAHQDILEKLMALKEAASVDTDQNNVLNEFLHVIRKNALFLSGGLRDELFSARGAAMWNASPIPPDAKQLGANLETIKKVEGLVIESAGVEFSPEEIERIRYGEY